MRLQIMEQQVPLVVGDDGVVRVQGSRVTLDTIVGCFERGATAEEIVQDFSTLSLADVYTIIGYYLCHKEEVDAYLQDRDVERRRIRAEVEARFPPQGIRERLLARRQQGIDATSGSR
jgi:uncharacterized protein (DUF433 family)